MTAGGVEGRSDACVELLCLDEVDVLVDVRLELDEELDVDVYW